MSANLQPDLDPVQIRRLEELGRLELLRRWVLPRHHLFRLRLELIQNKSLRHLPVRYLDFDGLIGETVFEVPILDEGLGAHQRAMASAVGSFSSSSSSREGATSSGSSKSSSSAPFGPKTISSCETNGATLGAADRRKIVLIVASKEKAGRFGSSVQTYTLSGVW